MDADCIMTICVGCNMEYYTVLDYNSNWLGKMFVGDKFKNAVINIMLFWMDLVKYG